MNHTYHIHTHTQIPRKYQALFIPNEANEHFDKYVYCRWPNPYQKCENSRILTQNLKMLFECAFHLCRINHLTGFVMCTIQVPIYEIFIKLLGLDLELLPWNGFIEIGRSIDFLRLFAFRWSHKQKTTKCSISQILSPLSLSIYFPLCWHSFQAPLALWPDNINSFTSNIPIRLCVKTAADDYFLICFRLVCVCWFLWHQMYPNEWITQPNQEWCKLYSLIRMAN